MILFLPEVALLLILEYVDLKDALINLAPVCKFLYQLIKSSSCVWRHIDLQNRFEPVRFSTVQQMKTLFCHAHCFHCFDVPGLHFENQAVEDRFDDVVNESLIHSHCLVWLDLSFTPLKNLKFLVGCKKLETLILGSRHLLSDDTFRYMEECKSLDYLDAGFTQLTGKTVAKCISSSVHHLELCTVEFDLSDLKCVLEKCHSLESIRIKLSANVTKKELLMCMSQYKNVCIGLWKSNFSFP